MNRVLIAVDDIKFSKAVLSTFQNMIGPHKEVLILHVERLQGGSLMIDMLGEAELSTLKESLREQSIKRRWMRRLKGFLPFIRRNLNLSVHLALPRLYGPGTLQRKSLRLQMKEMSI
jgi:hypothetical protein